MKSNLLFVVTLFPFLFSCGDGLPDTQGNFTVTIDNLSANETATILSAGVYVIKKEGFPLYFSSAQDYGEGLEELAEDGLVEKLNSNLSVRPEVILNDTFPMISPGQSISFSFTAEYGTFLNFATMFTDSNDLFYSFHDDGVPLFKPDGTPFSGDITNQVWLWDAGTEINEEPYVGPNQPGRQESLDQGDEEIGNVVLVNDGFSYPPKFSMIRVTISSSEI